MSTNHPIRGMCPETHRLLGRAKGVRERGRQKGELMGSLDFFFRGGWILVDISRIRYEWTE